MIKKPNQAQAVNLDALKPTGIPSVEEKKAVFERVWGLYYENYPSFQLKVVNWEKEKQKYEPLALQAATWPQFFLVVRDMILTLHDPHCFLEGAPLPQEYAPYLVTTVVDNQLVVVAAPKAPQLKPGTVILGVNGKSLTDCMDNLPLYKPDWFSPLQGQVQETFATFSSSPENLTVLDPHTGNIRDVLLPVYKYSRLVDMFKHFIYIHPYYRTYVTSAWGPTVQVREMGNGILYIHLYKMSRNLKEQLQPYMAQILKAKGIIIDVRDNPGGYGEACAWFAQHFYVKGMYPISYRPAFLHELGQWEDNVFLPLEPHISAPTAVLINGVSASAAEVFTAEMEVAQSVRTFGSRTAGACENTAIHEVMDGVTVGVPHGQYRVQPSGQLIEGVGIAPEVSVHESYPEFMKYLQLIQKNQNLDSADAVLQTAKKWVLSQMH